MSHNRSKKENVRYTLAEEIALLAFLNTRKVSADNGTTTAMNFKKSDWKAAADMLNKNKTDGEMRTYVSCKAKYRQLRAIYDVVKAVRDDSGWKWDDEKGANITPANKDAWDDYVAAHPKTASFRNRGWVHLAIFDVLGGGVPPKGFRASQGPNVAGSSRLADINQGPEDSPPWVPFKDEHEPEVGEENNEKELSDDEGKVSSSLATPAPSGRKRKATGPTPTPTSKKPRVSASTQALCDLTAAFNRVATILGKSFENNVPTSSSSTRKTDSMKAIMKLASKLEKDWLTKRQMALLLNIFEKEPFAAESYQLVHEDDELCREWIYIKLNISPD